VDKKSSNRKPVDPPRLVRVDYLFPMQCEGCQGEYTTLWQHSAGGVRMCMGCWSQMLAAAKRQRQRDYLRAHPDIPGGPDGDGV